MSRHEKIFKKAYFVFIIIYCGWLLLIWSWPSSPYLFCFDDSFYYFQIARNTAQGFGLTFDRINLTNGFHPLWMIVCIPVYWLGVNGLTAVHLLLSVQILLWLCVCWMIGRIYNRIVSFCLVKAETARNVSTEDDIFTTVWIMFAAIVCSPFFLRAFVNGLESAVYAVLYTVLLWQTIQNKGQFLTNTSHGWRIAIGGLGALCFLARTDAGFLLICLGVCCLIEASSIGSKAVPRLIELFVLPAVVFIIFVLFNYVTFGSPLQVSGELKRIPLTTGRAGIIAVGLILSCVIGWIFKNRGKLTSQSASQISLSLANANKTKFLFLGEFINNTWWFAVFCCLIIIYYTVMQAFPQLWYFGPVLLYGLCIFLFAATDMLLNALSDDLHNKRLRPSLPKVKWILLLPLVLCVITVNMNIVDRRFLSICIANQHAGEWISKNLPENAILGSWDAGVIAYFTSQKIINLDGLVNSVEYAHALKNRRAGELLKKQGIAYLVNHGIMDNGEDKELKQIADELFGRGTADYLRLEKTWPFTFRGSSNRFGPGIWPMAVFLYKIGT